MTSKVTDTLCTECGLCCDGSLFDDVELSGVAEATKLELMGLAIDTDDQPSLLQPCTALQGTRCSIYTHRPTCCRTFECRLLQEAQLEHIALDEAKEIIVNTRQHVATMKELCRQLGEQQDILPLKERCIEVLSLPCDCDDDHANQLRSQLALAMDTMGILLHDHFLGS